MVEPGAGARLREYGTNVIFTHAQREYLEARAAAETQKVRAASPAGRGRVTISDIVRLAVERLADEEPVDGAETA